MAFNSIVLKKVTLELHNLIGYKIDKVCEPDKNTIILGLYGKQKNYNLLTSISSNNYRIHLTNKNIKNPMQAPNFCMLLRKHILGYKIKDIYSINLERIVFIELQNNENLNKPINKKLIIELMGKHSNIILVNENNIIIDCMRHTTVENGAQRDIYATSKYTLPKENSFKDINEFKDFYLKYEPNILNLLNNITYDDNTLYDVLNNILSTTSFEINIINNKEYNLKTSLSTDNPFTLNYSLDNYYYEKETNELFLAYRNSILNLILNTLKKYKKRIINIDNKISECNSKEKYKLYGELITSNLYQIPNKNVDFVEVQNYYDNCNIIKIPLDNRYYPSINAKKYFKKYTKLKNALEIVTIQKKETLEDINYIESIIYELEASSTIEDVEEIYEEISSSNIFKTSPSKKTNNKKTKAKKQKNLTKNKFSKFNPIKYTLDGYTIYVGRNNIENDILTTKFAKYNDIWFHTKDIHGSHVILKVKPNEKVTDEIIYEAAKLAAKHSKAKLSSNIPVDYCTISNVKKPNGSKPGMVIYKNNKTIIV